MIEYSCVSCRYYWDNEKCAVCYRYNKWQPSKKNIKDCGDCVNCDVPLDAVPCLNCRDSSLFEVKNCFNCEYDELSGYTEPCAICDEFNKWKAKPEKACTNCNFYAVPIFKEPCLTCEKFSNWKTKEEPKISCLNCIYYVVYGTSPFQEPCLTCDDYSNWESEDTVQPNELICKDCSSCYYEDFHITDKPCCECASQLKWKAKNKPYDLILDALEAKNERK
jgi:hypothetical protein